MPLETHITESDIKAYIPELSKMLWSGQADYTAQKDRAIEHVSQMLKDRGHSLQAIMTRFTLRKSGVLIEDKEISEAPKDELIQRSRWVFKPIQFSPGTIASIRIEGSFDRENWQSVYILSIDSDSEQTGILPALYTYYRVVTNVEIGAIDFVMYLVETGIEKLIIYKWLELIMLDKYSDENDMYFLKMKYFRREYEELAEGIRIFTDSNNDGEAQENEFTKPGSIKMLK